MSDLASVLAAFQAATQCEASVWAQPDPSSPPRCEAATLHAPRPPTLPMDGASPPGHLTIAGTDVLASPVAGPRPAWLFVGPSSSPGIPLDRLQRFLLPVVSQYLQSALEVEHAANELAERYEEINLLYTISEILGRTVSLGETARTILAEVSETVGARRASILVFDPAAGVLRPVAVLGTDPAMVPAISVNDECSVGARVFATQHPMLVEAGEMPCEAESSYRRGAMLSVPIMWTAPPPGGAEPLGVVNLSDRSSGLPFTAGDQKLMAAIATQIGTAIQNARLVVASLDQQRLAHEMQLAHDLQMKLLPAGDIVAPDATVAARVMPAESVGGDFYNLFRLGPGRTGVMIGDVSGHGYQAALIMALTMSAAAIQAQRNADPGRALHALLSSVLDELTTTEMFISAFYAVIDLEQREIQYANTGHPHAFVLSAAGTVERLAAVDPPLGMVDRPPTTVRRPWTPNADLLVLFTDGVVDARNASGERLGE
ncbi:MAG TPA: GAF domain-containing SpoIIE family protein phosphatase, partial [Gemmatimonadaceae bacterium]|nr:GAF domain-containing SpoIIE family protein phosphatase [Gemmatimonadaceae bacterium]